MPTIWLIVVVVIILVIAATALVRNEDPFKTAAGGLGLNLTRSVPDLLPKLEGMINGLPIRIDIAERTEPVIRYRVFYPDLGIALKLQRETTITRTLGQLGENDTQVGARAFDDSFRVNTSRPDALRTMMTPELRKTLEHLIELYPKIVIEDGVMTLLGGSASPPAESIESTTIQMAAAAQMLSAQRPPPLEKPRSTRPAAATPAPTATSQPADVVEETAKPEPQSEREPQLVEEPPSPPPPAPSPAAPPQAPATGLPDGFFDDVFGANRLSFESGDTFEKELKGTGVTLAGTVKQARDQDGQVDPSIGAATKAIVTVAQIDNDLYGKTDIDAIVYLPAGLASELDRGDSVAFRGTLDQVDPFMRNLVVIDAALVR